MSPTMAPYPFVKKLKSLRNVLSLITSLVGTSSIFRGFFVANKSKSKWSKIREGHCLCYIPASYCLLWSVRTFPHLSNYARISGTPIRTYLCKDFVCFLCFSFIRTYATRWPRMGRRCRKQLARGSSRWLSSSRRRPPFGRPLLAPDGGSRWEVILQQFIIPPPSFSLPFMNFQFHSHMPVYIVPVIGNYIYK